MLFINLNVYWKNASPILKNLLVTLVIPQQNYQGGWLYTFQILVQDFFKNMIVLLQRIDWFLNGISTLFRLFNAKAISQEEQ